MNGWDPSDEGQRKCCLDNVRIWSSGPTAKYGDRVKSRHKWSAGRRACRSNGTRHLSEVPPFRSAFRRSAPSFLREKEEKALPQRQTDTRGR